ncbi:hypothetical protein J2S98_001239 [Arthrobacter oryzae]|nr:hypothetical protein [Arthrobacter oryzae]MDP9986091.1 hypothetical protein [Arthrobacter oryzae]
MGKQEKSCLRFCDYYSWMSYADFTTWVEAEDESAPGISFTDSDATG